MSRGARMRLDELPPRARAEAEEIMRREDEARAGRSIALPKINTTRAAAAIAKGFANTVAVAQGFAAIVEREALPSERRMKQDHKPLLNKLEEDYRDRVLYLQYKPEEVRAQSFRIRLANGQWYKPDFFVKKANLFIEVKGPKSWRGGLENLKTAATQYPEYRYKLVWRERRGGPFLSQEVLP
ncbi:MAG: hypothetical protein SFV32_12475 [Opitutaceae bacterium]|nr:hypothetical protein [Opitutaceae bacterium]